MMDAGKVLGEERASSPAPAGYLYILYQRVEMHTILDFSIAGRMYFTCYRGRERGFSNPFLLIGIGCASPFEFSREREGHMQRVAWRRNDQKHHSSKQLIMGVSVESCTP